MKPRAVAARAETQPGNQESQDVWGIRYRVIESHKERSQHHTGRRPTHGTLVPDLALRTRGAEAHVPARHKDVRARAIDSDHAELVLVVDAKK